MLQAQNAKESELRTPVLVSPGRPLKPSLAYTPGKHVCCMMLPERRRESDAVALAVVFWVGLCDRPRQAVQSCLNRHQLGPRTDIGPTLRPLCAIGYKAARRVTHPSVHLLCIPPVKPVHPAMARFLVPLRQLYPRSISLSRLVSVLLVV